MSEEIVILSSARTPIGAFQGELSSFTAPQLGGAAIHAAIERAHLLPNQISEVLIGCVLPAGIGQAPARQAAVNAGLPFSVPCTTVNKMCGSGMKALMLAYDGLHVRPNEIIVAGGMESMSNAPYILPKMRAGMRLGHGQVVDHMFFDGLEDAYDKGKLMGVFAEDTANLYNLSRVEQDEFAIRSTKRAQDATISGAFADEIAPLTVKSRSGETQILIDESPRKATIEKIPSLKPAFREGGTVTAANSSSISDGGAALILTSALHATELKLKVEAKIIGTASHARAPHLFTTAPVGAIETLLKNINWNIENVDLFEINEAFAVVTMCAIKDLKIPVEKVNIYGGACALGHPIGASGARIIVTLIHALKRNGKRRGVAALCIGGGEATAVAIEVA